MNIYDFDNTIFLGDSSVKFFWYSLFRYPIIVLISVFKALFESIKYIFKRSSFGLIKSELYSYVKYIDDLDKFIEKFVNKNMKNIKVFYKQIKRDDDVIISASFDFIVRPFCERLGLKYIICTKYDTKNGIIIGKNNKGEEKIVRFKEIFGDVVVENAYSDSLSDIPMFNIAKRAYLVKGEKLIDYKTK